MNNELAIGAGEYLKWFESDSDRVIIEKCLVNYAFTPITVSEKISKKIYMIFEALAHLFNMSDRDYALDAVQRRVNNAPISKLFSREDIVWFSEKSLGFAIWDQEKKYSNKVMFLYKESQKIDQYVLTALQIKNDLCEAINTLGGKLSSLIGLCTSGGERDAIFDVETLERISKKVKDNESDITRMVKGVVENKSNIKGFFNLVGFALS